MDDVQLLLVVTSSSYSEVSGKQDKVATRLTTTISQMPHQDVETTFRPSSAQRVDLLRNDAEHARAGAQHVTGGVEPHLCGWIETSLKNQIGCSESSLKAKRYRSRAHGGIEDMLKMKP